MNRLHQTYSAFIESICDQFGMPEAAPALQNGFHAYCEASSSSSEPDYRVEQELFDTLVRHVKFCLTEDWNKTVSTMKYYHSFRFDCVLASGCAPTLYINFLTQEPNFSEDPNAIEICVTQPTLVQFFINAINRENPDFNGENPDSMKDEVTSIIMDILNQHKQDIIEQFHDMLSYDITGKTNTEPANILLIMDEILSANYSPEYKTIPFEKFATKYMKMTPIDAIKDLAELITFNLGSVITDNYEGIANLSAKHKLTTQEVLKYLTGVYHVGQYNGCNQVIQLNNGMIYHDGYVYDRDQVKKSLSELYDTTFYEDVVETWNDHDYRREELMHRLRGNHTPFPREHTVHRLRNGNPPDFREWIKTPDNTGKRPIDKVLESLTHTQYASKVKQRTIKEIDDLYALGKLVGVELPAVESIGNKNRRF